MFVNNSISLEREKKSVCVYGCMRVFMTNNDVRRRPWTFAAYPDLLRGVARLGLGVGEGRHARGRGGKNTAARGIEAMYRCP